MGGSTPVVGQVVSFDERRGTGGVRGSDGAEFAFHCTRIADGSRTIDPGSRVVFVVGPGAGPGTWEATVVVKLG